MKNTIVYIKMSIASLRTAGIGLKVTYLGFAGMILSVIIAHAQYGIKIGELYVVILIPLVVAFMLAYSCGIVQKLVERKMMKNKMRRSRKKGKSGYMLNSMKNEVIFKSMIYTLGFFVVIYFLFSLILTATPPLINFVISIDIAAILALVVPRYLDNKHVIRK